MFKLELPFYLTGKRDGTLFKSSTAENRLSGTQTVVLAGLSISIETGDNSYRVISERPPEPDGTVPFRGTLWPRCLLPVTEETAVEQQLLLPSKGDAVAFSWRLSDRASFAVRLKASPIFLAARPFSRAGFEIESETNGGRLAWRPYHGLSKIIADTNGLVVARNDAANPGTPVSFEFELSSHPAVLIFSIEPGIDSRLDPLIGGFLARLTEERDATIPQDHLRRLIAA